MKSVVFELHFQWEKIKRSFEEQLPAFQVYKGLSFQAFTGLKSQFLIALIRFRIIGIDNLVTV